MVVPSCGLIYARPVANNSKPPIPPESEIMRQDKEITGFIIRHTNEKAY